MGILEDLIKERNLPELMQLESGAPVLTREDFLQRREEIKEILQREQYGFLPKKPEHLSVECVDVMESFAAGRVMLSTLKFTVTFDGECVSFPVYSVIPKFKKEKLPAFVLMNFRPNIPDRCYPTEEICDGGFAVFSFGFKEITSDDGDFANGIAKLFAKNGRDDDAPGKLMMWAWAAMRVMDYIETLEEIDCDNVAIIGHSRLGKTALIVGAFDERFKYVISNGSGTSGAAAARGTHGESLSSIVNTFPYWYCPKFLRTYTSFEQDSKFDQHFLMALVPPRHLCVGSAKEDIWADPEGEFLTELEASRAYEFFGIPGLIHNGTVPRAKSILGEGNALYQIREGVHYLSREDWLAYMGYIDSKLGR